MVSTLDTLQMDFVCFMLIVMRTVIAKFPFSDDFESGICTQKAGRIDGG